MINNTEFDHILRSPFEFEYKPAKCLGQVLFLPNAYRNEDSFIILSHIENRLVKIKLGKLRYIVLALMSAYRQKEIERDQTVMVITLNGCNELFTALHFLALACMGCRVFLPMYTQIDECSAWLDFTGTSHIIIPESEVAGLASHDQEKQAISQLKAIAASKNALIWDQVADFGLIDLIQQQDFSSDYQRFAPWQELITTDPDNELLIVTTSGSSGDSRLVVYTHRAYYYNCLAWSQAGFYKQDQQGGTSFTPLFTHTMGIRALINALWTGQPVCLIITEWFIQKPEIVRYLLLEMKPAHITGGPAVFNTLLEFFRIFPELKSALRSSLHSLISSGAGYKQTIAEEIYNATGLRLHNALGTSETQQVTSTLLNESTCFREGAIPIGKPLPGVILGLKKTGTGANLYQLYVKSVFGCKYFFTNDGRKVEDEYIETGDLVVYNEEGNIYHSGRVGQDYFKDSFGVKIPLPLVRAYYQDLISQVLHMEFFPLLNLPGLTALIFVKADDFPEGLIEDKQVLKKYAGIAEGINNRLMQQLDTFEYRHRHICRIALINQLPPFTSKGTVSGKKINLEFSDIIERLVDDRKDTKGIIVTDQLYHETDRYTRFVSPLIGSMLSSLKLNLTYHRARKDSLFTHLQAREREILDLVGGYGTNLTGYSHPVLKKAMIDFIESGKVALCNQLSIQCTTGLLAEKLSLMIGQKTKRSYRVIFANSGSEAVEIAIHHAYFTWIKKQEKLRDLQLQAFGSDENLDVAAIWKNNLQKIIKAGVKIIGLSSSFHGHSASARSILGNAKFRNKFESIIPVCSCFIDDRDDWQNQLNDHLDHSVINIDMVVREEGTLKIVPHGIVNIIAAIAEPVIGEGGVRVVNRDLLTKLSTQEFPLISDEIQCGLGRTGSIPEFESAQYYLLGKALGGGVEKIAAVLIDANHFQYKFSEYYVSTFANGELAAQVAINTLDIIKTDDLVQRIAHIGSYLQEKIEKVKLRHPEVINKVQGKGLMLAIYFRPECAARSILLRMMFQSEKAGYVLSGWFLHRRQIRILPTLSAPNALRVEPSAYFSKAEADQFCQALEDLCILIEEGRTYELFSYLMDDDPFDGRHPMADLYHYNHHLEHPAADAVKVAFIAHFVFPLRELRMLEPDLQQASDTGLRIFFRRIQTLMEGKPVQIMATHLFRQRVHFSFHALALDSAELEYLHKSGQRRNVIARIQQTIDAAAAQGARIISLGGYTSILSNNGLTLSEPAGARIITGNTLTAASGLVNLERTLRSNPHFNKANKIAIIGFTGNIGRIITEILAEKRDLCESLLLISRSRKLPAYLEEISVKHQGLVIECTTNLEEVKTADVVVISTNTNDPIIFKHHIAQDKPVIISDVSVPSAVSEQVKGMKNVTVLPFSAYVSLPEDRDVVISSYSPPGTVFCCAAEAILLALENCEQPLKGKITTEAVQEISRLATKYGLFENTDSMVSYKSEVGVV